MSGSSLSLRAEELSDWCSRLVAGEQLTLSGVVYAADDDAVRWLWEQQEKGKPLSFSHQGAVLCSGVPALDIGGEKAELWEISSLEGMNQYIPQLLREGLNALVGRGRLGHSAVDALTDRRGICLAPLGGSGALNARTICAVSPVTGEGLREGALLRLGILELPLVVTVDAAGGSLYERGQARYQRKPRTLRW